MEKLYTINEVAARFGVSRPTVYDWMNRGLLPYVYVGLRRRVRESALHAFLRPGNEDTQAPKIIRSSKDPQGNSKPAMLVGT